MSPSSEFWDKIALKYSRKPVPDESVYQQKLEVTQSYFRPEMEVLEIGCGTGSTAIVHAPHVRHIRAVDISPKMIEIAREKAAAAAIENVDFEVGTVENLSPPDQSLDAVLGLSILHLLEDREGAIAEVHRMLVPGGVFVSSTACLGDMNPLIRLVVPVARMVGLAPMVAVFTSDELVTSLENAGFKIDHQWQPGKGKAVFIVAKKAE
jgi:ubiquinone/menaquinone biosynthesis C-methylase UbiE